MQISKRYDNKKCRYAKSGKDVEKRGLLPVDQGNDYERKNRDPNVGNPFSATTSACLIS